jgi:hypothetical protein
MTPLMLKNGGIGSVPIGCDRRAPRRDPILAIIKLGHRHHHRQQSQQSERRTWKPLNQSKRIILEINHRSETTEVNDAANTC